MTTLIVPPGKKTGCLERASKVGQWCPLASEQIEIIPRGEWPDLIGKVNLRKRVHQIKDQDGVGSCATESTAQSIEITRDVSGQDFVQLNPWFIYYHTSGGRDRGSSIDENLRFVRERGVAPETIWPRSNGWRTRPSEEAYEAARKYRILEFYDITSTQEVGSALLLGFPVVYGWQGHSCVLTRLLSVDEAEYANSWGTRWGDEGFGRIGLHEINFRYGAYAVRVPVFNESV